jgi:phycocyanin-associated, rod
MNAEEKSTTMLGQATFNRGGSQSFDNRIFVYEVKGLRQNQETEKNNYQFRSSDSIFIQVPFQRMNEEMRRLTAMGGEIVSIRPVSEAGKKTAKAAAAAAE